MKHTPIVALDHIAVNVRSLKAVRPFYVAALGAIGMRLNGDYPPTNLAFGSKREKVFWLAQDRNVRGEAHYAFRVDHPEEVDAFHAAAVRAGGTDNGAPGPRPHYGPHYYAAFVKDPDGNNIEVVCYARIRRRPTRRKPRKR